MAGGCKSVLQQPAADDKTARSPTVALCGSRRSGIRSAGLVSVLLPVQLLLAFPGLFRGDPSLGDVLRSWVRRRRHSFLGSPVAADNESIIIGRLTSGARLIG